MAEKEHQPISRSRMALDFIFTNYDVCSMDNAEKRGLLMA